MYSVLLAFCATAFTYFMTLLGSATVFFFKKINEKALSAMLGFSSGIMLAACFWSLLIPSMESSSVFVACFGFISGGIVFILIDKFSQKLTVKSSFYTKSDLLLFLSVTLHNIPEGLAVGVAFGNSYSLAFPISVALGIGIQNFPEGAAISMPLYQSGFSKKKSFYYGQLSGAVEPVFGIIGALLVTVSATVLPYALSFASGAMTLVLFNELIPDSKKHEGILPQISFISGFIIMTLLDNLI